MELPDIKRIVSAYKNRFNLFVIILFILLLIIGWVGFYEKDTKASENSNSVALTASEIWITAPNIPPIPKYKILGMNVFDVYSLLSSYSWDVNEAYAILKCESGGNPSAENWSDRHRGCSGSFGLFQMACLYGTKEELLNPEINVKRAHKLWSQTESFDRHWVNCSKLI